MADENLPFYDLIIDIESFEDLKSEGWKILTSDEGNAKYEYFKDVTDNKSGEKLLNRVGILGVSDVGKTFILKKLIGKQGNTKATKGISVIYPEIKDKDKLFVCLDSQGSEEPIIDEKKTAEEVYKLKEDERKKLVKDLSKDKKFTEIFIQDFIIKKSNILIVVVDQLTFSEQKLINRLKNENFDKLFIIHNIQFFGNKEIIEDYIENIIKKSIFSNLEKSYIINMDENNSNLNENNSNLNKEPYYYKEKEFGIINNEKSTKKQQVIIHLFMAKEGSDAGKFFNDKTIDFIKTEIMAQTKNRTFDVLEEIKEFLSFNSITYMIKEKNKEKPIDKDEIEIKSEKDNDVTFLQCKNKDFQLKDCIINEMGISNFTSEYSINPSFMCYKGKYENKKKNEEWPALIVKTEMFVNAQDIETSKLLSEDNETMNITISCEKKFEKDPNIIEEIEEFEGGDIKQGNMTINIKFNLRDFKLDEKKKPQVREPFPGIKLIYFKISDKTDKNDEIKTDIIQKEKKPKKEK